MKEEIESNAELPMKSGEQKEERKGPLLRARSLSMTPTMLSAAANWNEVYSCSKNKVRAKSMLIPSRMALVPPDFEDSVSKEAVNAKVKMKSFSADDANLNGAELSESKVILLPMQKQIETSYPKFYRSTHPDLPVSPTDSLPDISK